MRSPRRLLPQCWDAIESLQKREGKQLLKPLNQTRKTAVRTSRDGGQNVALKLGHLGAVICKHINIPLHVATRKVRHYRRVPAPLGFEHGHVAPRLIVVRYRHGWLWDVV